jgi:HAD superfamily hydrolase (TIGR01459 family)
MPAPRLISGLAELAPHYDALICDIWGVVHDGHAPYADAAEALRRFRDRHGPVVLLTNAPRSAESVQAQFRAIGVPDDCYDAIVTSGGAARADLETRVRAKDDQATGSRPAAHKAAKLRLYYIGPERDASLFDGLAVARASVAEAEVALCTGLVDDLTETPDDYADILAAMKARGLAMICANPDLKVHRGEQLCWCAGALARDYEALGGSVIYYGKPRRPVYDIARSHLSGARHILAIGDGLVTDIRGANAAGLDALFIADGVHGEEIEPYTPEHLERLFASEGVRALAVCRQLAW